MSNESFAEYLGIGVRTVASWHQKPEVRPQPERQQLLDTALERASSATKARFADAVGTGAQAPSAGADEPDEGTAEAEQRLTADPNIGAALD